MYYITLTSSKLCEATGNCVYVHESFCNHDKSRIAYVVQSSQGVQSRTVQEPLISSLPTNSFNDQMASS